VNVVMLWCEYCENQDEIFSCRLCDQMVSVLCVVSQQPELNSASCQSFLLAHWKNIHPLHTGVFPRVFAVMNIFIIW